MSVEDDTMSPSKQNCIFELASSSQQSVLAGLGLFLARRVFTLFLKNMQMPSCVGKKSLLIALFYIDVILYLIFYFYANP